MRSRTHLALGKDTPMRRPVTPSAGRIVAISQVGGLHHRYHRIAAKTTVGVPPTDFSTTHCLSLANIASAQISLTLAQRLAILQAMRDAFRAVAVLRSAVSTRRDLLLENLALRHQLGVLARSGSTFFVRLTVYSGCVATMVVSWRNALVLVGHSRPLASRRCRVIYPTDSPHRQRLGAHSSRTASATRRLSLR
jgi:hypothetical protein